MARALRSVGIVLLAGAVWSLLAGAGDWLDDGTADRLASGLAVLGVVFLGGGLAAGAVGRASRPLRRGRCARCGAPTQRGQTYCLDHLLETVKEYRDRQESQEPAARRRSGP